MARRNHLDRRQVLRGFGAGAVAAALGGVGFKAEPGRAQSAPVVGSKKALFDKITQPANVSLVKGNDALSHLVAISMTPEGLPFRLFTVNRWVTGEVWYRAEDVIRLLDVFMIDHAQPSWPVNRWVTAMLRLFKPQIADLLRARDRKIERWQEQNLESDVFEDRDLEVTSFLDISVDQQIQTVAKALMARQ